MVVNTDACLHMGLQYPVVFPNAALLCYCTDGQGLHSLQYMAVMWDSEMNHSVTVSRYSVHHFVVSHWKLL